MKRFFPPLLLLVLYALVESLGIPSAQAHVTTAPYAPTLISPYNWQVFVGKLPQLCARDNGDPDGDAIVAYQFVVTNAWDSGWTSQSCVTPATLPYGDHTWKARVKDAAGEVSPWSDVWVFTLDTPYVEFTDIHFDPPSPSAARDVRIFACTKGHAGVGVSLQVSVNDAADGSAKGAWHIIKELGVPCFNEVDVPHWDTTDYADGPHLVRIRARVPEDASWEDALTEYRTYTLLPRGVPEPPRLLAPADGATLSSPTVAFRWQQANDATGYRLLVAEGDNPEDSPVVDVTLDGESTAYTATLPSQTASYVWRVIARNDVGQAASPIWHFTVQPVTPAQVHTLILFPRARMEVRYGRHAVASLAEALARLAADARVRGVLVDPTDTAAVAAAYAAWDADPTNVAAANHVAGTIKQEVILSALSTYPNLNTLILVGNDDLIPFRRLVDPTGYKDALYGHVAPDSPIGAAFAAGYFLSDDYYGALRPRRASGRPLYLPDLVVARLVETPADIQQTVDTFLAGSGKSGTALITGYSFMADAALLQEDLLIRRGLTPRAFVGSTWTADEVARAVREGPWGLLSLNQHATHWSLGAPRGDARFDVSILQGLTTVQGALALGPGCQAGLNVPDGDASRSTDWPQAFLAAGASFVGNTGFGWGVKGTVGYSERLVTYVIDELTADGSRTVGEAVRRAKRRYRAVAGELDTLDEKVLQELTLYGIPQSRLDIGGRAKAADSRSPSEPAARPQGLTRDVHVFQPDLHWADVRGDDGRLHPYAYSRDVEEGLWVKSGWPAQPLERIEMSGGYVHGVLFAGGIYSDVVGVEPFVPLAENEVVGEDPTTYYPLYGWAPARLPVMISLDAHTQSVLAVAGQYRLGVLRLYPEMTVYIYKSYAEDTQPPRVLDVEQVSAQDVVTVTVAAQDEGSSIHEVWVTYTEDRVGGQGRWQSVALRHKEGKVWQGTVPITRPIRYMVQVVDGAGNVAVADNDGAYFRAPTLTSSIGRHCGGVGPLGENYCACVWGYIHVGGERIAGAEVTLTFNGRSVTTHSDWGAVEDVPYYDLSAQDLGVRVGDVYTLTVRYGGQTVVKRLIARPDTTGEQQVDVWVDGWRVWVPVVWR